jgi:atrial natriuretic peptide receptor A
MADVVTGLHYLHHSSVGFHGNLKSRNCLIDSRFVVRLSGFGPKCLWRRKTTPFSIFNQDSFVLSENIRKSELEQPQNNWQRSTLLSQKLQPTKAAERCLRKSRMLEPASVGTFDFSQLLWTSPDLLWLQRCGIIDGYIGNQKGDIHSLAMIFQEILLRKGVFYLGEGIATEASELVDLLSKEDVRLSLGPEILPLRPSLEDVDADCDQRLLLLTRSCWANNPSKRPDMNVVVKAFKCIRKGDSNILDNLLKRMEQYTENLEELVELRHGRMARGGHRLPKLLPGPAMPDPSTPCGLECPNLLSTPCGRAACSRLLPLQTPHAVRL